MPNRNWKCPNIQNGCPHADTKKVFSKPDTENEPVCDFDGCGAKLHPIEDDRGSTKRPWFVGATILALVILGVLLFSQMRGLRDPKVLPPDDFVEYWAAGHLNLEGKNPYDSKLLIPLEEEAGRKEEFAVMMWNPPWTLSFVMPYGAIHPFDAKVLWLLQNFLLVLISADWLWRIYGGPRHLRWLPVFGIAWSSHPEAARR